MLFKTLSGKSRFMKRLFFLSFLSLVVLCFSAGKVQADELAKLLPLDGNYDNRFGHSVSIDGNYAIVGVSGDDDNGYLSGSAYIFKRDGEIWSRQVKLTPSDGSGLDSFGASVSIDGEYAIVGSYGDDDRGIGSGSAYIFKRDGETWSQQDKLLASDGAATDHFGYSVCVSTDYAIVGAIWDGSHSGSAYIFKRDGTAWTQQAKLLASDGYSEDYFGVNVSIDGEYAIVGSSGDDDNGESSGSAYIFRRDGTAWSQQAKLIPSDGYVYDRFGCRVSIDGDYVIIGANRDDDNGEDSGSAYIFKRDGSSWTEQTKLLASDGGYEDYFGCGVSISGDYAIVGAFQDDDNGRNSGSAYIFRRDGTVWNERDKLLASDGAYNDNFGYSVSIDGEYAIVGAPYGSNAGSAYIFEVFEPEPVIEIAIDIKPHTCPNRLNINSNGLLTVAVLGTEELDVYDIDPASVTLNGVSATRSSYKDILTSAQSCTCEGVIEPDGFDDLIVKFEIEALAETLGHVNKGDELELLLTGVLDNESETPIEGIDCIVITVPVKQEEILVPDVVGLPLAEAETVIIDAGLTVGTITEDYSDTITAGDVISQDPASSELLPPGGVVDLVISLGPIPEGMVWIYIDDPGVPEHEGFNGYMSKYETTNAQYCKYLNDALASGDITVSYNRVYGANGSNGGVDFVGEPYFETYTSSYYSQIIYNSGTFSVRSHEGHDMSSHPVVEVSWYGAMAFASYYGWRLPTEWEWQAVADYDGSYIYGCGTSIDNSKANYGLHNPLGFSGYPWTTPVGYYPSCGYGLNDMAGNVWEWTSSTGYAGFGVARGGSWYYIDDYCTVSSTRGSYPYFAFYDFGFRVCR